LKFTLFITLALNQLLGGCSFLPLGMEMRTKGYFFDRKSICFMLLDLSEQTPRFSGADDRLSGLGFHLVSQTHRAMTNSNSVRVSDRVLIPGFLQFSLRKNFPDLRLTAGDCTHAKHAKTARRRPMAENVPYACRFFPSRAAGTGCFNGRIIFSGCRMLSIPDIGPCRPIDLQCGGADCIWPPGRCGTARRF